MEAVAKSRSEQMGQVQVSVYPRSEPEVLSAGKRRLPSGERYDR
jgi:hypothetical protein